MKHGCLLLSLILAFSATRAQKQNNTWYFGEQAGVSFNTSPPLALTNGALSTLEGCAAISNAEGDLLFYSDGVTVWNKDHQPMINGTGLEGHSSSTQACMIVPLPYSKHIYYLFTTAANGGAKGLRYNIIDMRKDSGRGEVILKNALLHSPATEKLTAAKHRNQRDYWIITHDHGTDLFRTFLLTPAGLNPTPVMSQSGSVHPVIPINMSAIGQMKVSPDARYLAVAVLQPADGFFELFDFDAATGKVSNPATMLTGHEPYGVEFSPGVSKLYVSTSVDHKIIQYDLQAGDRATIAASYTEVGDITFDVNNPLNLGGALQLAPDGRIYLARRDSQHLGVISRPEEKGAACGFQNRGLFVGGRKAQTGLPSVIQSYFLKDNVAHTGICYGERTGFTAKLALVPDSFTWDFDDPDSGAANLSGDLNPSHTFSAAGSYEVKLIRYFLGVPDTLVHNVVINPLPALDLGADHSMCPGDSLALDASFPGAAFQWHNGSRAAKLVAKTAGIYRVESVLNGCKVSDEIRVDLYPEPTVNLGNDTTLCKGQTLLLDATSPNSNYRWQDNSTHPVYVVDSPGRYTVEVTNNFGCTASDEVWVPFLTPPVVALGNDTTLCAGDIRMFEVESLPGVKYVWQDGATQPVYSVSKAGIYAVTASVRHCTASDEIQVMFLDCGGGLFIPNVITPNNDGKNDDFVIHGLNDDQWMLNIFNRWGEKIFETPHYHNNWMTQIVPQAGTYYYHLFHRETGRLHKGWVQVIL